MSDERKVLSIQSCVVSGYVGNKSATFPLQTLGFDVSTINSVQFSNHTGYAHFKGQVLDSEDLQELYSGLKLNNILHFSHLLTGYIGSVSFLKKVHRIIQDLRQCNPDLIYVCDPVMGDNDKMYVPEDMLPIYRDLIVPSADICTPNQFEIELLTGLKVTNEETALEAMYLLHDKGVTTVVLSSTNIGTKDTMVCLASSVKDGLRECYSLELPYYPGIFVGTGDLFAALLLAWLHTDRNLKIALEKTISTLHSVCERTITYAQDKAGPGQKPSPSQMEIRLVQSKKDIERPEITLHATRIL